MYCRNCGNELQNEKFCPNYGKEVEKGTDENVQNVVTVYRKNSFSGIATPFDVYIDSQNVAKLWNGQSAQINLSKGKHDIYVKQVFLRSNIINFNCCGRVGFEIGFGKLGGLKLVELYNDSDNIVPVQQEIVESSNNQAYNPVSTEKQDDYVFWFEENYNGKVYALFIKPDVLEKLNDGTGKWSIDDVVLRHVRVKNDGTKVYLPIASKEIIYKIVSSWNEKESEEVNETNDSVVYQDTATQVENNNAGEVRVIYINNNSMSSLVAPLKIYNCDNEVIGKISHNPLTDTYTVKNESNQFVFRIDVDFHHKFSLSFDETGENVVFEFGKKSNFDIGFGTGHFVILPLASLPFGSIYGASRMGNVYVQKNKKFKDIYLDNNLFARVKHNAGSFAASKSRIEIFTDDDELQMYAIALFICMHALN